MPEQVWKSIFENVDALATEWTRAIAGWRQPELLRDHEVQDATRSIAEGLQRAVQAAPHDLGADAWRDLHRDVDELTRTWRDAGVGARDMSRFMRGLNVALLQVVDSRNLDRAFVGELNAIVDELVLWTVEARMARLNTLIERQRDEMEELSTPVIEVYEGIVVLPLIGTLDSERAERAMESLLEGVARYDTRVAILDITGVPTVDTLVAERLLKTVEAARLMGSDCMVSGIGPRIAQTMVNLGVDAKGVETTSRLSDALERAFRRLGLQIVRGAPTAH